MNLRIQLSGIATIGALFALALMVIRPREKFEIRTYSNNFNGLMTGISTREDAIRLFGKEINVTENSNNTRYEYASFAYTIEYGTEVVNTILIAEKSYRSADGFSIGDSSENIVDKIGRKSTKLSGDNCITNIKQGIVYWIDDGKIQKIVLASRLKIKND